MKPGRILRAAKVLRAEAQCLRESYGRGAAFEWPEEEDADDSDRQARADHDEMIDLAGELEALARHTTTAAQTALEMISRTDCIYSELEWRRALRALVP